MKEMYTIEFKKPEEFKIGQRLVTKEGNEGNLYTEKEYNIEEEFDDDCAEVYICEDYPQIISKDDWKTIRTEYFLVRSCGYIDDDDFQHISFYVTLINGDVGLPDEKLQKILGWK